MVKLTFYQECCQFILKRIYSINLSEVLIHDYLILKKYNILQDENICFRKRRGSIKTRSKVIHIPPDNSKILKNKK